MAKVDDEENNTSEVLLEDGAPEGENVFAMRQQTIMTPEDSEAGSTAADENTSSAPKKFKPTIGNLLKMLLFVLYEVGIMGSLVFSTAVLIPNQVIEMVGEEGKSVTLAVVLSATSLLTLGLGPLAGYISDKMGRVRMPFIIVGTVLWVASILIRSLLSVFGVLTAASHQRVTQILMVIAYAVITTLGKGVYTVAQTPYTAMIVDVFPKEQYSMVSAFIGISNLVGVLFGVVAIGFIYNVYVPQVWICVAVSVVTCLLILPLFFFKSVKKPAQDKIQTNDEVEQQEQQKQEHQTLLESVDDPTGEDQPASASSPTSTAALQRPTKRNVVITYFKDLIKPFKTRNFSLVFWASFVSFVGSSPLQQYFLYFIRDLIHPNYTVIVWNFLKTQEQAQAMFLVIMFTTAIFSSGFTGGVSSRLGPNRKFLMIPAAISCCIGAALMLSSFTYNLILLSAFFWGAGTGIIQVVVLASVNDNLPAEAEAAKDLAVWNLAKALPQLLSPTIAGSIIGTSIVLDRRGIITIRGFGYIILFSFCAVCQIVAAILIMFLKDKKKK